MNRKTKLTIGCVFAFATIFLCIFCISRINSRSPDEWFMSGFSEKWYINEDTIVNLSNNPQNKNITLKYIITWESEDETKIYETEGIEAGCFVPWSPAKYLPKGESKITIRELPTYIYEGESMEFPYADQIITVTAE